MRVRTVRRLVVTGTAAALALAGSVQPAAAHDRPTLSLRVTKTISSAFVGPLQFAVSDDRILVADAFTSTLWQVGRSTPVATGPSGQNGGDLSGVAISRDERSFAYTTTLDNSHTKTYLTVLTRGRPKVVTDLAAFEASANPDGHRHYGVDNPSKCVADALAAVGAPATYSGQVDSHPYAVAALGHGSWAVADAGGNDIVKVDARGRTSVIAVLPRQPLVLTAAIAGALHLPACAIGVTYNFEPVPTDVEVGPDGWLYVSTLAGGPEDPSLGARSSVYRVNPRTGAVTRLATGFAGATNLALDRSGHILVAELFAGRISQVVPGHRPAPVLSLPGAAAIEYDDGTFYASTAPAASGGSGPGTVVRLGR